MGYYSTATISCPKKKAKLPPPSTVKIDLSTKDDIMKKVAKKQKKHKDDDYVKLRPFDKWMFDFPYFKSLSKLDQRYILRFLRETVNGLIVKPEDKERESILINKKAQALKLKEIKADPSTYARFKERKQKLEKKSRVKISDLDFVKKEWQRQFNREVKPRREDAYSRIGLSNPITEIDLNQVNMKLATSLEQELYHQQNDNEIAETIHNRKHQDEDINLFIKCQQADRIDYFIHVRLKELIGENIKLHPFLVKVKNELESTHQQYENKKIKKSHYYFFLFSQLKVLRQFAKTSESATIIKELDNVFKIVIYPKEGESSETRKTKKTRS